MFYLGLFGLDLHIVYFSHLFMLMVIHRSSKLPRSYVSQEELVVTYTMIHFSLNTSNYHMIQQ